MHGKCLLEFFVRLFPLVCNYSSSKDLYSLEHYTVATNHPVIALQQFDTFIVEERRNHNVSMPVQIQF